MRPNAKFTSHIKQSYANLKQTNCIMDIILHRLNKILITCFDSICDIQRKYFTNITHTKYIITYFPKTWHTENILLTNIIKQLTTTFQK